MGNGLTYKEEFIKFMVNGGILRFRGIHSKEW